MSAGGDSGVRISHLPSGDGVICHKSPISHWEMADFWSISLLHETCNKTETTSSSSLKKHLISFIKHSRVTLCISTISTSGNSPGAYRGKHSRTLSVSIMCIGKYPHAYFQSSHHVSLKHSFDCFEELATKKFFFTKK